MPELPDVLVYVEALAERILGRRLERVRLASPFLLRSTEPPLASAHGQTVRELRRLGKRIAMGLENGHWLVLHLMIAGRLHWRAPGARLAGRQSLAAFDFAEGSLVLTEAGSQKRASLHVAAGEEGLRALDPGGLEMLEAAFSRRPHPAPRFRGNPAALRSHARDSPRVGGKAAGRSARRFPGKGDGLPRRHGGPRALWAALPPLRRQGAAHPLCR